MHVPMPTHLGVWQMATASFESEHNLEENHDSAQSIWVVTAVRGGKVVVKKGRSLRHLLHTSLTACGAQWPPQSDESHASTIQSESEFKSESDINLSLFLPDAQFHTFKMPCMPQWGPQDIEAECRIEAARIMRQPLKDLILDFEVQAAAEGALVAHVMVCQTALVQASLAMFEKLGFKLNSLTCHSDLQAYAQRWKVSPDFLQALLHETASP